ncbi:unnamed protein product [Thelazia callipaeda]|uniref:WH2 domain-containing protein n=1 Tax=Thelazia callipaeda TaxID=103827 RepID=A0A0N5D7A9_THECL|nr:unnamed protein product [Thelazia callipaeda]
MFSRNRSEKRIGIIRSGKGNKQQRQIVQQNHHRQELSSNPLIEGSNTGIPLPLFPNKLKGTSCQVSTSTASLSNRLPPPPPPPRSPTTTFDFLPSNYQRTTQKNVSFERRSPTELLQIRLETVSKPNWAQASLSTFLTLIIAPDLRTKHTS